MKLSFDESLSPRLVESLRGLFPESESALHNGLSGSGDLKTSWVISPKHTSSFFARCNYPTDVAADVLRRNAIRIAELPGSQDHLIILDR